MSLTTEREDSREVFRRVVEIALAGLLHDVGKVFQRADWPLSQGAEKLQDDLCPVMEGRAVHWHVLWTYDFCNDNLKWLAEYVDLARVMRLATGHHRPGQDDPAMLILDAADRIVAGAEAVEVEELQPVIPPQVPLESILWNYAEPGAFGADVMKSRRRRGGPAAGGEPTANQANRVNQEGAAESEPEGADEGTPHSGDSAAGDSAATAPGGEQGSGPAFVEMPRVDTVRRGYFAARVLGSDEDVLPGGKRPEVSEQNYRELATDLVAAVQKIGRMTGRPRLEWLIESLRGVLESRLSLVPAYVGAGGQTVSLYSHAAAMSAVAAALWRGYERTGVLPAGPDARPISLIVVHVAGVEEYLCRPAATEESVRVYHGRASLVRLVTRLVGDSLLRELRLPSVNRLSEGDDTLVVLGAAGEETASIVQSFVAEQGAKLFEQTAGYLQLAVSGPVAVSYEQFGRGQWAAVSRELEGGLQAAKSRLGMSLLQDGSGWREEAAVVRLADRHGQLLEAGEWARLQEAYERQLGTNLIRGKAIAVYSSPVTPVGVEGEATAVGSWFVHVGASPEGLIDAEGLEQIYISGAAEEAWAWVPVWRGVPHVPTYRRADESQLRVDAMPSGWMMAAGTKRRDMAIGFEELGWLSRRSRKGRGFAGRSWLGCLQLEADGLSGGWTELVSRAESLGQIVEAGRQGQWFWQGFIEGQLRRADRATWRVFVLRSGLGKAVLVGPWNTMMVLAGRLEQWWRRWAGLATVWPVRGALSFGPRDVPVRQLAWQAEEGLIQAEPSEGAARVWLLDHIRNWSTYREALRLSNLLDEQVQTVDPLQSESGIAFLRRFVGHDGAAQRTGRAGRGSTVAWRAGVAQDMRKLLLRQMPRRGQRTAAQEELIEQLQALIATGRRGRLPASVGLAARIALWQNQGETS